MTSFKCEKCGALMGLAESICHACGQPAPAGRAAQVLKSKAESAYEAGNLSEAVRQLAKALDSGLPSEEQALAWRKLGVWQEKLYNETGLPEWIAAAENSYHKAFQLNDADDTAHQLFISSLGRQGRLAHATQLYQERLAKDPADAVAARQLAVIKLAGDIKAAPVPKVLRQAPSSMIERWLTPSPVKLGFVIVSFLGSLIPMFFVGGSKSALEAAAGSDLSLETINAAGVFNDPWIWGLQAAIWGVILVVMLRNRQP